MRRLSMLAVPLVGLTALRGPDHSTVSTMWLSCASDRRDRLEDRMGTLTVGLVAALTVSASPFAAPAQTVATLHHVHAERLAISTDGTHVYVTGGGAGGALVDVASGEIRAVPDAPAWAGEYWNWKSGRANPANSSELIAMAARQVASVKTQEVGVGSVRESQRLAPQEQLQQVTELKLRNTVIGSFTGKVVPGLTFGWAPALSGWVAYRDKSGRLAVLDTKGHTFTAPKTQNVWLPAWAPDASRIYFVQQQGDIAIVEAIQVDTIDR